MDTNTTTRTKVKIAAVYSAGDGNWIPVIRSAMTGRVLVAGPAMPSPLSASMAAARIAKTRRYEVRS